MISVNLRYFFLAVVSYPELCFTVDYMYLVVSLSGALCESCVSF